MTSSASDVRDLLARARHALGPGRSGALEAEVLLGQVLGVGRAWLFANGEHEVAADQRQAFETLVARRARGEPIAYLTGEREFWSLPLQVTPDVLIPRHETELLVQVVLDFIPRDAHWRVADLGTGSGAVALAIASERPACEVHATEINPAALVVARANVARLLPGRVALHHGSWCEPLPGRFQVIASNPPYVAEGDPHLQEGDCRFEPATALTPGGDGLDAIRRIAGEATAFLEPGGLLAFEHGFEQGWACRELLRKRGYAEVMTVQDLEGRDRVTRGNWPG